MIGHLKLMNLIALQM